MEHVVQKNRSSNRGSDVKFCWHPPTAKGKSGVVKCVKFAVLRQGFNTGLAGLGLQQTFKIVASRGAVECQPMQGSCVSPSSNSVRHLEEAAAFVSFIINFIRCVAPCSSEFLQLYTAHHLIFTVCDVSLVGPRGKNATFQCHLVPSC